MNNKGGQSTFRGIRYQKYVTLTLFLQYLYDKELQELGVESPQLDDAHISLSTKRIIIQSKYREKGINISSVKDILGRENFELGDNDEFLLITNQASKKVIDLFNSKKYDFIFKKQVQKYAISSAIANKIKRSYIWVIEEEKANELISARASEILGIYLPQNDLKNFVARLLEILERGATSGKTWSASEIKKIFEAEINYIRETCGSDALYKKKVDEINEMTKLVKEKRVTKKELEKYSAASDEYKIKFLIESIAEEGNINIDESIICDLLDAALQTRYPYLSSKILDLVKGYSSKDNSGQILSLLKNIVNSNILYFEHHKIAEILEIIDQIIQNGCDLQIYKEDIFYCIKKCLEPNLRSYFFNYNHYNSFNDNYYKNLAGRTLKIMYETADNLIKEDIINFVFQTYNLTTDSGRYFEDVPIEIYEILSNHLASNFDKLFSRYIEEIAIDFDENNLMKRSFNGWELSGGMISGTNGIMEIEDRALITNLFRPAVETLYATNPEDTYKLIKNNFIVDDRSLVSRNKPNFLNRVAIPFLIDEINTINKEEAIEKLKSLANLNGGSLYNADVISECLLAKINSLKDEDVWNVILTPNILAGDDKIPTNSWAEQIVTELALRGSSDAQSLLRNWFTNKEFIKNERRWSNRELGAILRKVLGNEKSFSLGVDMLNGLLSIPDEVLSMNEVIDDIAEILKLVISQDFNAGKQLLLKFKNKIKLNKIYYAVYEITEKEKLKELYVSIYEPIVKKYSKNKCISVEIPDKYDRISIIKFGERLFQVGLAKEGWKLFTLFINDPDPIEGDTSHIEVANGADHISTSTVRGELAYALKQTASLRGREYLPNAIELLEKFIDDPNYSVRAYSSMTLIDFMQVRHSLVESGSTERFLPDLNYAKRVEKIFWRTIQDKNNQQNLWLMDMLARAFNSMRFLDDKSFEKAYKIFKNLKDAHQETYLRILNMLVYYAEIYKESENKKIPGIPESYIKTLSEKFDNTFAMNELNLLIKDKNTEITGTLARIYRQLPKNQNGTIRRKYLVLALKRFSQLIDNSYNEHVAEEFNRFIIEYIRDYYEKVICLWKKSIDKEFIYINDNWNLRYEKHLLWMPNHQNDEILLEILKKEGFRVFYIYAKKLLCYPIGVYEVNSWDNILKELENEKYNKYENLLKELKMCLFERYPLKYRSLLKN